MSAMAPRISHTYSLAGVFCFLCLLLSVSAQGQDVGQYLGDRYQGKIFVLRGFQANDILRYDSSGSILNTNSGDWTTDGFVQVSDIRVSDDDRLIIRAQRMVVGWSDRKQFEFRPLELGKGKQKKAARVEINADPGMHNPSQEQVDTILSKIFLTGQDNFADLVPDYWNPCVRAGSKGADKKCAFSPEILAIPGVVAPSVADNSAETATGEGPKTLGSGVSRMGKGISPPRPIYMPDPEFSEGARAAKFQGAVVLSLLVNKEGGATNIRISQPLGYGLDVKAVEAVRNWKFDPAEKDGQPVAVPIAVEVNFHLY